MNAKKGALEFQGTFCMGCGQNVCGKPNTFLGVAQGKGWFT